MANGKPGRPKGLPKYGGRAAGSPNKKTIEKSETLATATRNIFSHMTVRQMENVSCLEVWQICLTAALIEGDVVTALAVAKEYAPYKHAKLAPKIDNDDREFTVHITGGLPK